MTSRAEQCDNLWQAELLQVKGSNEQQPRSVATQVVSAEGFTPINCRQSCGSRCTLKQHQTTQDNKY